MHETNETSGALQRQSRRLILKGAVCVALDLGLAGEIAAAQTSAAASRPRAGDWLVPVEGPATPITATDIVDRGKQVLAWAMDPADGTVRSGSRLNQVLLVRIDQSLATDDTRARAADGVVAYTAICTHTGCEVTDWLPEEGLLYCACHYSKFDPRDSARVVDGPAPRALPALPLAVAEGRLVVAAPFTTRVGFETV